VREAGLLQELVRDLLVAARGCPPRCCLGELIRLLVARHLAVGGDPADGHLVVSGEDPATDLHRRDGEALAWAQGVGPHPVDGGGGVDEDRVPVATLLALVQDPERLVDGEGLRIEYLFVCPEVKAASGPATG
jgi:hypothetical protein